MRERRVRNRLVLGLALVAGAAAAVHLARLPAQGGSRGREARAAIETTRLPSPPREIPVGSVLPPLVLPSDRGPARALSSFRGAPTVLLFFRASSCPVCRAQLTAFAKEEPRFAAAGLQVVAASPDPPGALAELRGELGLTMALLSDPDEQAVNALCGGLSHCELLADAGGVIRWGAFAESWSHAPGPAALLAAVQPAPLASADGR